MKASGRKYQIAVIGGDGIGPDVVQEALKVLTATGTPFDSKRFDISGERYLRDGETLSNTTVHELRKFDAILFGAIGTPEVPPSILERGIILKLRFDLDLYINMRPVKGVAPGQTKGHEIVVIRENTEGSYVGEGGVLRRGTDYEVATQGSVNTAFGVARCVRYAFELAASRPRRHLTLVHKTNILQYSGDLWQRIFDQVAVEFPTVTTAYFHVDAACIYFVNDPHRFDVIVTDNLFGDIITDLGASISGGIGRAASANLNPMRSNPSLFEPVHGSAPDIAGKGIADPTAAILSAALMIDFLGENEAATRITAACQEPAFGSTKEIGDTIASRVSRS
ncbi:MAG: 3-isopropylmalate dehydrogenase [Acidimicrobiaceae bacterium]|nr:3-isopropylmalate dehydrogenase [Acidimicrobiaceae bacterium]